MKRLCAKLICFVLLAAVLFSLADNWLYNDSDTAWAALESWENADLDLVFLGNSRVFCNVNPVIIHDALDINTVLLCSPSQPIELSYYNFRHLLSRSKPKAVALECSTLWGVNAENLYESKPGQLYRGLDGIRDPLLRAEAVLNMVPVDGWAEAFSQLFRPMDTWTRWAKKSRAHHPYGILGYQAKENIYNQEVNFQDLQDFYLSENNTSGDIIPEDRWRSFERILDLAQKNGVDVYLIIAPTALFSTQCIEVTARARQLQVQYPVIRFVHNYHENMKQMGLTQEDFFDESHLNRLGAVKFSEYLARDIGRIMELPVDFSRVAWYRGENYEPLDDGLCRYTVDLYGGCLIRFTVTDSMENIIQETDFSEQNTIEIPRISPGCCLSYTIKAKEESSFLFDHEQRFAFLLDSDPMRLFGASSIQYEQIDGQWLRFTNTFQELPVQYAWYVFKNEKTIHKEMYSNDNVFKFEFSKPGSYSLRAFIRSTDGSKYTQSCRVAEITVSTDGTVSCKILT